MLGIWSGLPVALNDAIHSGQGFNLVATAPTLEHIMAGWGLFGFASTFLIGAYNERPTVLNNATFAFAAYRISDFALLTAAALTLHDAGAGGDVTANPVVAGSLLLAAVLKSSQFPLTSLFARSMEGPTPASALGYAGLSAHMGTVLLASTMPLWFEFDWARAALAGVGVASAVHGTLVARVRADRKGALAHATSASIGLLLCTLAAGQPEAALALAFGHASLRMVQILRAPNFIADMHDLRGALGKHAVEPPEVPDWLFRTAWAARRMDSDVHLLNILHRISNRVFPTNPVLLTKHQQWAATAGVVTLCGAPFTPIAPVMEHAIMELVPTHPALAAGLMVGHFGASVLLMRFLLLKVLHRRRFDRSTSATATTPPHNM